MNQNFFDLFNNKKFFQENFNKVILKLNSPKRNSIKNNLIAKTSTESIGFYSYNSHTFDFTKIYSNMDESFSCLKCKSPIKLKITKLLLNLFFFNSL